MLLIGMLIGLLNGVSVALFKMPPFMVTLVSMMFYSALAIYLPKSENIMGMPKTFVNIGREKIFEIFSIEVLTIPDGDQSHVGHHCHHLFKSYYFWPLDLCDGL